MMWDDIRRIAGASTVPVPAGYGEAVLLPVPGIPAPTPSFWMVGQYKDQTRLATALRQHAALQTFVAAQGVRFGLRDADRPPAVGSTRQESYGARIVGPQAGQNFAPQRVQPLATPMRPGLPAPASRRGDEEANVKQFWATQTPQSHHVVEFNHLRDLGVSRESGVGPLDHGQLPCVLLAAEFHQRYVSSILKQTHGWNAARLRTGLAAVYQSLYVTGGAPFRPLWEVSRAILRAAGITVP